MNTKKEPKYKKPNHRTAPQNYYTTPIFLTSPVEGGHGVFRCLPPELRPGTLVAMFEREQDADDLVIYLTEKGELE